VPGLARSDTVRGGTVRFPCAWPREAVRLSKHGLRLVGAAPAFSARRRERRLSSQCFGIARSARGRGGRRRRSGAPRCFGTPEAGYAAGICSLRLASARRESRPGGEIARRRQDLRHLGATGLGQAERLSPCGIEAGRVSDLLLVWVALSLASAGLSSDPVGQKAAPRRPARSLGWMEAHPASAG
jgi:hypothetical protein